MKTFKQFQEDYARVINPVKPVTDLLGAGFAAVELGKKAFSGLSNIFQAKRSQDTRASRGRRSEKPKRKLSAAEKKIFDGQKKDIMQKGSDEFSTKGLIKRNEKFTKQTTRGTTNKPENQFHTEDAIPTNNASSGNIAGLPPDDPPVKKKKKKKKKYIYGGRGSRKMWMNNK